VARSFKLFLEFAEVVDLAVENDGKVRRFIPERLAATG
jgi:hypothetical protein